MPRKGKGEGVKASLVWVVVVCLGVGSAAAKPLDYDRHTPIVDVVKKLTPSVVAIRTDIVRTVQVNPLDSFFFGLRGRGGDPMVQEQVLSSAGSGIIVDEQGIVISNSHVVSGANRLTCTTSNGEILNLVPIGLDSDFDIAVLRIDTSGYETPPRFEAIDWGVTSDLMIGESVVVLGSALSFENSVTSGVISAVERTISVGKGKKPYFGMIQTDAAINRGNSGGPVVNIRGELIGIATLIASEGGGSDGIGFAIPVERVSQVYNEFVNGILSLEERLGIEYVSPKTIENIDPSQRERLGLSRGRVEGLLVASLDPNGLAARHQLQKQDLLLEIDGTAVTQLNDFQRRLEEHPSGTPLQVGFLRFDPRANRVDRSTVSIPTDELDSKSRIDLSDAWLGMEITGIDNDLAQRNGVVLDAGVAIRSVEAGSPARDAGLAPGDLIVALGEYPVQTLGDFRRLRSVLRHKDRIETRIRRGGQLGVTEITNPGPRARRGTGL